jgi:hypothetical protein
MSNGNDLPIIFEF